MGLKGVSKIHEIRVNPLAERVQGDMIKKSPMRQVPRNSYNPSIRDRVHRNENFVEINPVSINFFFPSMKKICF